MVRKVGTESFSLPRTVIAACFRKLVLHFSSSQNRLTDIVSLLVVHWDQIETAIAQLQMLGSLEQHCDEEEEDNSSLHPPKGFQSFLKL